MQRTLTRFETTGIDKELAEDYEKLLEVSEGAIKQQWEHTKIILEE